MPILDNQRHELFAQALFRGQSADEAYQTAGYKPNRGNASTLKANQSVINRIAELRALVAERAIVDRDWVIAKLVENVQTCMTNEPVKDALGNATLMNTHNPSAANKALELLGKELGMFVDKSESLVTVEDGTELLAERFRSGIARIAARARATALDKRTVN